MTIANAYDDHRFDQSVDDGSSFKHRTILCMAIKNSLGQIIGVIQLINKFDSLVSISNGSALFPVHSIIESAKVSWQRATTMLMVYFILFFFLFEQTFTKNDENFVEAFAIFCGMGIHNTHMYEKAIVAMAKQSVTLEVLSYHASASMEDAHRLRVSIFPLIR